MGLFFRKKRPAAPTTIHPEVGAELEPAALFTPADEPGGEWTARKVRVEGTPPDATLVEDPYVQTPYAGYVLPGVKPGEAVVLRNRSGNRQFEVWELEMGDADQFVRRRGSPRVHPDQDAWAGIAVLGASRLPRGQAMVALICDTPRPKHALGIYDLDSDSFRWLSEVDVHTRDMSRIYEHRACGEDVAIVIYYTGRTRKSAEVYHNYFHHILVFAPRHPGGLEAATVGIDTGNVVDWALDGTTLLLRTLDNRDVPNPREGHWSLDLSRVLAP